MNTKKIVNEKRQPALKVAEVITSASWSYQTPKDKSNTVFYANKKRFLKCTKPMFVKITKGVYSVGRYVHSQKEWIDLETFVIDKVECWIDPDSI